MNVAEITVLILIVINFILFYNVYHLTKTLNIVVSEHIKLISHVNANFQHLYDQVGLDTQKFNEENFIEGSVEEFNHD